MSWYWWAEGKSYLRVCLSQELFFQVLLSGVWHIGRRIALMTFNVSVHVNSPARVSFRTSLGWVLMAIRIWHCSTLCGFLDTESSLQTSD